MAGTSKIFLCQINVRLEAKMYYKLIAAFALFFSVAAYAGETDRKIYVSPTQKARIRLWI
jgi:hypothetical protein